MRDFTGLLDVARSIEVIVEDGVGGADDDGDGRAAILNDSRNMIRDPGPQSSPFEAISH